VVAEVRVRLRLENELGLRVRHVEIGRDAVVGNGDLARRLARIEDVEEAVGGVTWIEREAEQTPLAARQDLRRDVEESRGQDLGAVVDADDPRLLDDEQPHRAVAGIGQSHRVRKPAGEKLQGKARLRLCPSRCEHGQDRDGRTPHAQP
jgi:hypothetical protein